MRLAGRLAFDTGAIPTAVAEQPAVRLACGYHGIDILVRRLTESGFIAEMRGSLPQGARVRLRLPGLGAAHAEVLSSEGGEIHARFSNPIGAGRLSRVPGMTPAATRMNAA